jgi:signal transduction histidine kinase/CheY-like chemotaxis protein
MSAAVAAADPRIRVECVRTLYQQLPNSFVAAMGVSLYMVVTQWPYAKPQTIALWLALQAAAQVHRFALWRGYRRATLTQANADAWGLDYAIYMISAGVVWAACAFLFFRTDQPITQALTMCGLYGITAGSVPANAYYPRGLYVFLAVIFGAVMARMLLIGDVGHIALGVASVFFALIMVMFGRVQHRTLIEGFQIRFENVELVAALKVETQAAEAARARAEQANLAKSQFLAAASHDLRQPLHALGLFSASLETLRLDDEGRAVVGRIQDSVGALESLFDALLDVSKLDAGVVHPQLSGVNADGVFARMAHYSDAAARAKGLALRFAPCGYRVLADPALLEQILANLVANAVRYTEAGGVLVGCRRAGAGKIAFEVRDSGIGVAPADTARIFEEFVQLANPERDRRKGLGLGLAIAQRTAALMDTTITLRSAPGRGSVFRFEAPLTARPTLQPAAPAEPGLDRMEGLSVLFIDDEEAIRDGFVRLLRQWGAQADAAPDLASALTLVGGGRSYQVVLADYRLRGGETGVAAIEALMRAQTPPPAACLVTGDMSPDLLAEARRRGLPLLHKPVRPAQLRAVLAHLTTVQAA